LNIDTYIGNTISLAQVLDCHTEFLNTIFMTHTTVIQYKEELTRFFLSNFRLALERGAEPLLYRAGL
jgi:hypothetical protein